MIQNCQAFETRVQYLLDQRIDPETDNLLESHAALCCDCREALMGYSLLHAQFLSDSDSMKIKLESLGLGSRDVLAADTRARHGNRLLAVAASLAAMLVLIAGLYFNGTDEQTTDLRLALIPAAEYSHRSVVGRSDSQSNLEALAEWGNRLNQYDLYHLSTELPPIRSIKAVSICLDWLQKSWHRQTKSDLSEPELGRLRAAPARTSVLPATLLFSPIPAFAAQDI